MHVLNTHHVIIEIPYTCQFESTWYKEGDKFNNGPDNCIQCICIDSKVICNEDNCTPPSTTTSSTTLPPPVEEICQSEDFKCLSCECIAKIEKCDLHNDCKHGSDEDDCGKYLHDLIKLFFKVIFT